MVGVRKDVNLAKAIGKKIKNFRMKKYPKYGEQKKCAEDFGVNRPQWARWESGTVVPEPETMEKLARFFGVTVKDLYGDAEALSRPRELTEDMKGLLATSGNIVLCLQRCQLAAMAGKLEEFEFAEIIRELNNVFRKKAEKFNIDGMGDMLAEKAG